MNLFSQFPKYIEDEMEIGLKLFTNYQFDSAKTIYSEMRKKYPYEPLAWFYLMNTEYEILKNNGKIEEANDFLLDEIKIIEPIFKKKLNNVENKVIYTVYYGSLKGVGARVNLFKSNYLMAFSDGLKANKLIKDAFEMNPQYYDVYLPLGSYNFYGGVMADHYSAVSMIYDSEKKRKLGINQLKKAYENGVGAKWEAGRILLLIYLHETKDYDKALKIGEKLVTNFPNNLDYKSLYIELLINLDETEKAKKILKDYSKFYEKYSKNGKNMWKVRENYLQAVLDMKMENYNKSLKLFQFVIDNYNLEFQWFKVLSYLKIGQIYDLKNDRENAKKYYILTIDTKETTRAVKDAKIYLEKPFKIYK